MEKKISFSNWLEQLEEMHKTSQKECSTLGPQLSFKSVSADDLKTSIFYQED